MQFPKNPFKSHGGVKVPHEKYTAYIETVKMPAPKKVIIPMQQHIGLPCEPTVEVSELVDMGQVIGESKSFVSAPIHSSISGRVSKIIDITLPPNIITKAIEIESDGEFRFSNKISPPSYNDIKGFLAAVYNSGLVGLGGAGFPAHVKLSIPKGKNIDTLIINAAECEPYITSDNREIIENAASIFHGIKAVAKMLKIENVIIAIEDNKPKAIKTLLEYCKKTDFAIQTNLLKLKSLYPQGAEKVLIKSCTNRSVPPGKLPLDVGCIVMNITSISFLGEYLKTGIPLISKRLTVAGSAIKEPKNIICPIGTPVKDIVDFCGGYLNEPKKIIMGGPLMGLALRDDSTPIIKQNNALIAFSEKEAKLLEPSNCIRCGRCVNNCPMNLMPYEIERIVRIKDSNQLEKLGILVCMECGCCSYNCPAKRNLVENIRMGKSIVIDSKKGNE
jgi:electron transport complex protein RnfC